MSQSNPHTKRRRPPCLLSYVHPNRHKTSKIGKGGEDHRPTRRRSSTASPSSLIDPVCLTSTREGRPIDIIQVPASSDTSTDRPSCIHPQQNLRISVGRMRHVSLCCLQHAQKKTITVYCVLSQPNKKRRSARLGQLTFSPERERA